MTVYCVRLKLHHSGKEVERSFDSMTARNIFVIGMTAWADVLKEWEAVR